MIRLRDRMREDLELRGLSANTVEAYVRCARRFVEHFGRPPAKLGAADVRSYLLHLVHERRSTPATALRWTIHSRSTWTRMSPA